jgi:hypothetical protein
VTLFVVIGRVPGEQRASLAVGPLEGRELAERWREDLERTTRGIVTVLPLHTPVDGALGESPAPVVDPELARELVPDGTYGGSRCAICGGPVTGPHDRDAHRRDREAGRGGTVQP